MFNKYPVLVFILLLLPGLSKAQQITFDKKSGNFQADGKVIANLSSEKVKSIGKSYYVKDAAGTKTLLSYELHSFEDTFGSATVYYYSIEAPEPGYKAYRPNFTSMNTFKEVGELVVAENLLQADGSLNSEKVKAYFEENSSKNIDYPSRHAFINDSLMKLVNIPSTPAERDMRKPIIANEYGKIGQDNVVIGFWELVEGVNDDFNHSKNYKFIIRNLNGGIVCVSWIRLSGSHTYAFKNGMRTRESWQGLDLVNNNPISSPGGQQGYAAALAQNLIRMGLL
jgi:hypothetical protein